jgi:NAD(P) transhydrogenase subunit alpha
VSLTIALLRETRPGERRVALVPESVARLTKAGQAVVVERGAGASAAAADTAYEAAGATLADGPAAAAAAADIVCKVQRPTPDEAALLREGSALVSYLHPSSAADVLPALAARRVTGFALELVPRITRAQSMDALSSQATVAGYKAVLLGAAASPRFLPMLTTAAGSIPPAKAFILGAGVAGLQAIATARRLGAQVSAFDVRAAAAEQVLSLGATVVARELLVSDAETKGGYAREQTAEEKARIEAAVADHLAQMDLVITTAAIPGRPAPRLISAATVDRMRPGAVIVDLAAETGGNCEVTRPGETVDRNGVLVLGPLNVPASLPAHASQMLSRNILTFLQHVISTEGALTIDLADEITGAMCVTHAGAAR